MKPQPPVINTDFVTVEVIDVIDAIEAVRCRP